MIVIHFTLLCAFKSYSTELAFRPVSFPFRLAPKTRVDETQSYTLEGIRNSLIQQEDSIIFSLVERAQLCYNAETYDSNGSLDGFQGSLLEYIVRETEKLHAKVYWIFL